MKKLWLLVVVALCLALPAAAEDETPMYTSGDYEYILLEDGTAEIDRYTGDDTNLTIPDALDGHAVTSIDFGAFRDCSSLSSITIPKGVTSIGDWAFSRCSSLSSISIPKGVTSIGNEAFRDCTSLTSITIPDSVTNIGYWAFYGCTSLTSISIPDSVTIVGYNPFVRCSSLTSINVSSDHPVLTTIDGVLIDKVEKKLICYPYAFTANEYNIPKGVTSIGDRAFDGCTSLSSINIPKGVTSIGDGAFDGCTSLSSITIPKGVTSIGDWVFYDCTSLSSITIPDSVTNIGFWAFCGCSSLTSINIPDSVTSIDDLAFYRCENLTITVTEGSYAEQYCQENDLPFTYGEKSGGLFGWLFNSKGSSSEEKWKCNDCRSTNTGKYCTECGAAKPVQRTNCPSCNYKFDGKNTPAFCPECGQKQ